jgi:hypothetical protein
MPTELTLEEWTQVRYEYEHTEKPVEDICFERGISSSTLRDRMRRWRWTRRRQPISAEGPPPVERVAPLVAAETQIGTSVPPQAAALPSENATDAPAPHAAPGEEAPADPAAIAPRLRSALARLLPAIEATLAKLAAGATQPREIERAARALTALTRTLRELKALLSEYPAPAEDDDRGPADNDEFIRELIRRMDYFAATHAAAEAKPVDSLSSSAEL